MLLRLAIYDRRLVTVKLMELDVYGSKRIETFVGVNLVFPAPAAPGNLIAFACKLSFQRGNEGTVSFYCQNTTY